MTASVESVQQKIVYSGKPGVTLEDSMGSDIDIVNAARVSFAKHSRYVYHCNACNEDVPEVSVATLERDPAPWKVAMGQCFVDQGLMFHVQASVERRLKDADVGLINYLMRERHGTPFEMVQFRFRVRTSIRVMREWQRHRIGSFNEQSTRYIEMEPEFYVPDYEAVRVQTGKPGHYVMEQASPGLAGQVCAIMKHAYDNAWHDYQVLIESGVAKEVAAFVLPLGLYSEQVWSVNLRSAFNFLNLRNHPKALREIREAAAIVEEQIASTVPYAMAAFNQNGRQSP